MDPTFPPGQLSLYTMAHYRCLKSTNCFSTNLAVSIGFSHANASIRLDSIFYWSSVPLERFCDAPNHEYRRKKWALSWIFSDFDMVLSVSTRLLSFFLMTVDLFACQTRRPMSRYQLWCVPWMWNQNWRDWACLKRPGHGTVFEENSALLEQAEQTNLWEMLR